MDLSEIVRNSFERNLFTELPGKFLGNYRLFYIILTPRQRCEAPYDQEAKVKIASMLYDFCQKKDGFYDAELIYSGNFFAIAFSTVPIIQPAKCGEKITE